jgi:hypothetical protein
MTEVSVQPSRPAVSDVKVHRGILHAFFAYDWGEAVDLEEAQRIEPAELLVLPRRRRTPTSFAFHPAPLRFRWSDIELNLPELGSRHSGALVTVFDFAGVSLDLNIPFELSADALVRLAGWLAEPVQLLGLARKTLAPLYERIKAAIRNPKWHETMVEEYFVFQFTEQSENVLHWQQSNLPWLANVLCLESSPLSDDETNDALRLRLSYTPQDLFFPHWGAAVLLDEDCEETLQAIEFANLQLLELRHVDDQLDDVLLQAEKMMNSLESRRLPHWHGPSDEQRRLGEMRADAATLFERSTNALKLIGDPYLARVFRLLTDRFRLASWEAAIQRKLEAVEGIYQVVSDQAERARSTALELIVITLIAVEIVLALVRH